MRSLHLALTFLILGVILQPGLAGQGRWSVCGRDARSRIHTIADVHREIALLSDPNKQVDAYCALLGFAGGDWTRGSSVPILALAGSAIHYCPDRDKIVDAIIERLDEPKRRLSAVAALIRMADQRAYSFGSLVCLPRGPELDGFETRAATVLETAQDADTIAAALDDRDDNDVRVWALETMQSHLLKAEWGPLLPILERHVTERDRAIAEIALLELSESASEDSFISRFIDNEKDPSLLRKIMKTTEPAYFQTVYLAKISGALSDRDKNLRMRGLYALQQDNRDPYLHVAVDRPVFDKVVHLTKSGSETERFNAARSLAYIQPFDPNTVVAVFVQLATDRSATIRECAAWSLTEHGCRPEAASTVQKLLDDPVPAVRYESILGSGPANHIAELTALAGCSDPNTAQQACNELIEIENAANTAKTPAQK